MPRALLLLTLALAFTTSAHGADRVLLSTSDREARYFVVQAGELTKLYAVPRDGSARTLLAQRLGTPRKLFVDDTFVYWVSERGTERVTKDGWEREVVVNASAR